MVKGCQRRTIHIKDTGSRYYEEAYFILRPGAGEPACEEDIKDDMIEEALRIAGESLSSVMPEIEKNKKKRKKGKKGRLSSGGGAFIIGFCGGALFSAALCFVFSLL